MIKTLNVRIKGNCLNLIKGIYEKLTFNIILNVRTFHPLIPLVFNKPQNLLGLLPSPFICGETKAQ